MIVLFFSYIFILVSLGISSIIPFQGWITIQEPFISFIIVSYFFFLGILGLMFGHVRLLSVQEAILRHLSTIDSKNLMFFSVRSGKNITMAYIFYYIILKKFRLPYRKLLLWYLLAYLIIKIQLHDWNLELIVSSSTDHRIILLKICKNF